MISASFITATLSSNHSNPPCLPSQSALLWVVATIPSNRWSSYYIYSPPQKHPHLSWWDSFCTYLSPWLGVFGFAWLEYCWIEWRITPAPKFEFLEMLSINNIMRLMTSRDFWLQQLWFVSRYDLLQPNYSKILEKSKRTQTDWCAWIEYPTTAFTPLPRRLSYILMYLDVTWLRADLKSRKCLI